MCRPLVFTAPNGPRVEIKSFVAEELRRNAQRDSGSIENGGILIGRRILDSHDTVVDQVTSACPTDVQSACSFVRNPIGHQAQLDRAWRQSGGVATYLGEWHTHPTSNVEPSPIDRRNWRKLARHAAGPLVFLIVGTETIGCWGPDGFRWTMEEW